MASVRWLTDISALIAPSIPADEAVDSALRLLQEGFDASDTFLVYGNDGTFGCFGSTPELNLSDIALWIVNRQVTSRSAPRAFDVDGGHVVRFRGSGSPQPCEYVAALIPMPSPAGEMLIARGSWPEGFGKRRTRMLRAALPALALILQRRLDADRAGRRHRQLRALADITRVFSEDEDEEVVLTSIAGTIAAVTAIDYVSIDLVNPDGTVRLRCLESSREGTQQLRERWKLGGSKPDPVRDIVLRSRKPMFFPDAQNDERIPENGRAYFVRTLLVSTAVLPLLASEDVVGVLSVASHRPLEFAQRDVDLLEGLAAQAATAVKGIQLYQEVAESRRQLQRLNEQLAESMGIEHLLARTDPLTGIPNRRYLEEALESECARASRYGLALSIVMIDIDHLKHVNDAYSHPQGDQVIRHTALLARETCRQADIVARYGGDEFVFVLPNTSVNEAAIFAERFRLRLAEQPPADNEGNSFALTVSLGVVEWDIDTMTGPGSLIDQVDRALYSAKAAGRDQTMIAAPEQRLLSPKALSPALPPTPQD
jgi:diguanylate cyclase (GGDEF)-like protein